MKENIESEHVDWRKVLDDLATTFGHLHVDDQWSFLRWELLKRNKFYRGVETEGLHYEGIFAKFHRLHSLISSRFRDNSQKMNTAHKILQHEFSHTCGLKKPVDPIIGKWKQCSWLPTNTDLLSQDIQQYGNFRGNAVGSKIRESKAKVESLANHSYQFPRAVDIAYFKRSWTKNKDNPKVVESSRSGLEIFGYKDFVPPRIRVDEMAQGLVIWDIKHSIPGKRWSYKKIASVLGIRVSESYGKSGTGTAHPKLRKLKDQFDVTSKRIRQAINSEYLSHWK